MRILFISAFSLFLTASALISSVPSTTKELNAFKEKITLQNAQGMFIRAIDLYYANQTNKMIDAYRELISKFENSTNRDIRVIIAQAMFNAALGYDAMEDTQAEDRLYEQITSKFADLNDTTTETIVANSFFNQALIAYQANDTKGEMQIYEKFIKRFESTNNENIHIILAKMMSGLGYIYAKEGKKSEAADIYNEFVYKFENSKNEHVQNLLAGNLLNLGVVYIEMGKLEDGLVSYQKLIEQFKSSIDDDIIQKIGAAVTNKIEIEICSGIKPSFSDENKKLADKSEYAALMYEFLQIVYAAANKRQTDRLERWRDKYSDFSFKKFNVDFDFSDLDKWAEQLKNPEKKWVKECVSTLKEFSKR
ncbi:MAG: tetratricopeptide repeat protein [Campylobacteraceae bacterium]|jgi:tetratricopeptide (TPR) repeat protein|nr:tetratricopeptide repeat protein [Campylobacteraceae bacterium]